METGPVGYMIIGFPGGMLTPDEFAAMKAKILAG
jgi:hypothetical protein